MRNEDFIDFLRSIQLPYGKLLSDGRTYKITRVDAERGRMWPDINDFKKILILSDGNNNVVGGVLFYWRIDIQVTTLPEHRGQGHMLAIHTNGVLEKELYEGQQASIAIEEIDSFDAFLLRYRMLSIIGIIPKNLDEIYRHLLWCGMLEGTPYSSRALFDERFLGTQ